MTPQNPIDAPVITERYPTPARGLRFRLTKAMQEDLEIHPLGRDLMPLSAGSDYKVSERRSHSLEPLPGLLIAYCSAGYGELEVDGKHQPVKAGDLVVLRKDTKVFLGPLPNSYWSHHFLVCDGELADYFYKHLGINENIMAIGSQPYLIASIDEIVALRTSSLRLNVFVNAACQLKSLLTWLAVAVADLPKDAITDRIDQSRQYMAAKIHSHIDLDEVAGLCGLSRYHYVRKFRERIGQSPIHYFIHLKMQRACELLETTEFDVREIAELLGYADPFYFSKLFKRTIGQSPQHFRIARVT